MHTLTMAAVKSFHELPQRCTQCTCGDDGLEELQVDDDGLVPYQDGGRRGAGLGVQEPQVPRLRPAVHPRTWGQVTGAPPRVQSSGGCRCL